MICRGATIERPCACSPRLQIPPIFRLASIFLLRKLERIRRLKRPVARKRLLLGGGDVSKSVSKSCANLQCTVEARTGQEDNQKHEAVWQKKKLKAAQLIADTNLPAMVPSIQLHKYPTPDWTTACSVHAAQPLRARKSRYRL